jgi:hypothetical protein
LTEMVEARMRNEANFLRFLRRFPER